MDTNVKIRNIKKNALLSSHYAHTRSYRTKETPIRKQVVKVKKNIYIAVTKMDGWLTK